MDAIEEHEIFDKPSKSTAAHIQQYGRGTRPLRDKDGLKLSNVPEYVMPRLETDAFVPDCSKSDNPAWLYPDYNFKAEGRAAEHSLNDGFRDVRALNIWSKEVRSAIPSAKRAYHAVLDWLDEYRPVIGGIAAFALTGAMLWAIVSIGAGAFLP